MPAPVDSIVNKRNYTLFDELEHRIDEAYDPVYFDGMYAERLFMAGDKNALDEFLSDDTGKLFSSLSGSGKKGYSDIPDYADIMPRTAIEGVQNHLLISSRISIEAIIHLRPDFYFKIQEPIFGKVMNEWIRKRWDHFNLDQVHFEMGMDYETHGIGIAALGVDGDGFMGYRRVDPLDCFPDPLNRLPSDWRYVFLRRRLSPDECWETYGDVISEEELQSLTVARSAKGTTGGSSNASKRDSTRIVYEWMYYDGDSHAVMLGELKGDNSIRLILAEDEDGELRYTRAGEELGPNPFGMLPIEAWVDAWMPGVMRPLGKVKTSWRTAVMLNNIEIQMSEISKKGQSITVVSTIGLTPETVKKLKKAQTLEEVGEFLLSEGIEDVSKFVHRVPAQEISATSMQNRHILKQELNAATGVMDAQRGQRTPGEKTAFEIQQNAEAQGVQAQHTRAQFMKFLINAVRKLRLLGAQFDTAGDTLIIDNVPMDTRRWNIDKLLGMDIAMGINSSSLHFKSDDQRKRDRMVQLQQLDLPGIQLGVVDPVKALADAYKDFGYDDPFTALFKAELVKQQEGGGITPEEEQGNALGSSQAGGQNPGIPQGLANQIAGNQANATGQQ